jgi:hypothetical protein
MKEIIAYLVSNVDSIIAALTAVVTAALTRLWTGSLLTSVKLRINSRDLADRSAAYSFPKDRRLTS